MRNLAPVLIVLFLSVQSQAQPEDEETVVAVSCSLSVRTTVFQPEAGDVLGRASIEGTLCDKSGVPIPYQTISMTSTNGTFSCIAPDGVSSPNTADRSCFVTDSDGKILVYLVDIPFNKPGKIKAVCTYGEFTVRASGTYSITRNVTRKKTGAAAAPAY